MNEHFEIKKALGRYRFLQECILTGINFSDQLTNVELSFNYIYNGEGTFRPDMNRNQIVTLKLSLIQVFRMRGGLNVNQLLNPELLDWGLNEVSMVKILDNSSLLKECVNLRVKFHHLEILWETDRKIDIIFNSLKIYESPKEMRQ